jgi:hypothetical protein
LKPQRTALNNLTLQGLHDWLKNHSRVLGGQLSFGATTGNAEQDRNIQCFKATGVAPAGANTEFIVSHNLGRAPYSMIQHTNNGGVVYQSRATLGSATQAFLKCTAASSAYTVTLL